MKLSDTLRFSFNTLASYRMRSFLIILAMALGVAAVIVLTALGDGARRYVVNQFSSIGTNLIIVLPGRAETAGSFPGAVMGQTPRDLTLEDAQWVGRLPQVRRYAPLNVGAAELSAAGRLREVTVLGSTADIFPIRHMQLAQGDFLSAASAGSAQIVLGAAIAQEFFPDGHALGQRVRLSDRRFTVTGILAAQGQTMGFNSDEVVIIPVRQAQALFNTNSLFRLLIEARHRGEIEDAKQAIRETLIRRHDGEDDVTVITQDAVLATFDRILRALTLGVAGIAVISLAVAGILVMNVMLVAVSQRTAEIGLLKAIGTPATVIRRVFLAEAAWLSLTGALFGFVLGHIGSLMLRLAYPLLPAWPPYWANFAAIFVAVLTGVLAGLLPATRAARLDPVQALSKR
ncbi:ABC transporter permease [Nitrosomonas sp. ANs5]|uniref:ABC transporter permease n=1 Tax=Nitrosomonas sp. ANs5 TaxID=3423941 RepID=UPI00396D1944